MPFIAGILMRIVGILGPIIAQIGWSLMTERLIRAVCGNTVIWIQETWFPTKDHPQASDILLMAAHYILPPKELSAEK